MALIKCIKALTYRNNIILINIRNCSTKQQCEEANILLADTNFQQKLLKVAVIGTPNSGKSTFINYLMDRKVCAASSKVHTTRQMARAIFTENDSQIVFLDTPGLVNDREIKKYKLGKAFVKDSESCLREADIISVVHDASNFWLRDKLDIKIINLLGKYIEKPSVLILNKTDLLRSKRKLLDITRMVTENCLNGKPASVYDKKMLKYNDQMSEDVSNKRGWPYFSAVFMVSALTGSGLPEIKEYFIKNAKPGEWMYPENTWSDQKAEDIILNNVKAKLLNFFSDEIPYLLHPYMEYFDVNDEGVITTVVLVRCPTERLKKLIAGMSDGRLRQITEAVQEDLQNAFQNFVRLKIVLEVSK